MLFSCSILIVFSVILANVLYRSGLSKANEIIKQRNYAVNYFIEGYFSEVNNTIEILAENEDVQDLPWLDATGRERVLNLFRSYTKANRNITYIYAGYENKELLINDYTPPDGYDARSRPWYRSAMAVKPEISTGQPYQDITDNVWLFSTSKALYSRKHGYSGVVSSDSAVRMVIDMLDQRGDVYRSSYSFVTKLDGEIILHHNSNYLKKNISKITGGPLSLDEHGGSIIYTLDGEDKIAYYSRSREPDWLIFTVVSKSEITTPIIWQIAFCIVLTGLVAVLFGLGQSVLLGRRYSIPLLKLRDKVKSIIRGDVENDSGYRYPENEIGVIASEVESLTAQEFYARSRQLEEANSLLAQKNRELEELYVTDWLTGLYNRHKIDAELEKEIQRSARYNRRLSVILFDVDWFKRINDTYGHPAGDSVLQELAQLLKANLRSTEIPGRWGGEEFIVLCPEIGRDDATALGTRLCSLIENHSFAIGTRITISVGVTELVDNETINALIKRVDDNLYAAKRNGRNRVVAA